MIRCSTYLNHVLICLDHMALGRDIQQEMSDLVRQSGLDTHVSYYHFPCMKLQAFNYYKIALFNLI